MDLSFSLKELEEIYQEANDYYQTYKESIEALHTLIDELSKYWWSEETNSYDEFFQLFLEKYKTLELIAKKMNIICEKIKETKEQLNNMLLETTSSFE